ncbi:MAG: hypothetical protein ABIP94_10710 [Planctomycetota bacterium]
MSPHLVVISGYVLTENVTAFVVVLGLSLCVDVRLRWRFVSAAAVLGFAVFADPSLYGYPYREDPEQPAFGSSWGRLREVLSARVAADPARYVYWYAIQKPVGLWGGISCKAATCRSTMSPTRRTNVRRSSWVPTGSFAGCMFR